MNSNNVGIVKTRFAPSPTGFLHIGVLRTALFNYVYAKQHGGVFILRIDDTDTERSKKEYETDILDVLQLTDIMADELYRQSERTEIYRSYLEKLLEQGDAYISRESADEAGKRSEVIRFKNKNRIIAFDDLIRGSIEVDTGDLEDFIIAKSPEEPLYHFASVVDDFELGITHVIRGEEHIANTPRQILMQEAIGAPRPQYAHLPLILAPDRSKLSKRHGAVSANEYIREGFLPMALINYMALLGWSPQAKGGAEASDIFSLAELISTFDLTDIQKGGAVFSIEKLKDLNRRYMRLLPPDIAREKIAHWLPAAYALRASDALLSKLTPVILERVSAFGEITALCENGELEYFISLPNYEPALLRGNDGTLDKTTTAGHLAAARELLADISVESWSAETVKEALWEYATTHGRGAILWPVRVGLSGRAKSSDPFTIAGILGKHETLERLAHAQNRLAT